MNREKSMKPNGDSLRISIKSMSLARLTKKEKEQYI